ncbi:MAG: DUF222 domain-containing protein [Acidimicrobiia bacterium]|nr:DUF222 domain-containing protein [Acidimicrobiia bacterium]
MADTQDRGQDERPLEVIEREITTLAAHINAATCRWMLLVAEFDRRLGWATWGAKSCAHWLNWRCGISLVTAREQVRVGRALPELPLICEAFSQGRLSYSKVRALVRVATRANETALLETSRYLSASQLERVVRGMRRVLEAEALSSTELARRQFERRCLRWHWDAEGFLCVSARLAPDGGARFVQALRAVRFETARVAQAEPEMAGAGDAAVSPAGSDAEPWERRDADGLVAVAESYLAHGPAAGRSTVATQIVVHTRLGSTDCESGLEGGPQLPTETAQRLACDADVVEVREDTVGTPLDVGRRTRRVPTALRRALAVRDGTCRFPGCTATQVDAHHMRHWLHGGETCLDNLVSYCRYHHHWVHEGGWQVRPGPDGSFALVDTKGRPYPNQLPWRGDARALAADAGHAHIDSDTAVPLIDGSPVDYAYVVDTLTQRIFRAGEPGPV